MGVTLQKDTYRWVIKNIKKNKDTDLFPVLKEYEILFSKEDKLVEVLSNVEISDYEWQEFRRFIIPKDDVSYRVATQLDPIDNIILTGIVYEYGNLIEDKRIPLGEKKVFNYRYKPTSEGDLYDKKDAWKKFWTTAKDKAVNYENIVYIDIADFYNRIYHHTLEHAMEDCGLPNQVMKAIKKMLQKTTQTVSQGIPVGPHATHILAEMCLIDLDIWLVDNGYDFCRYSDDILVFANNKTEAKIIIYEMAKELDYLKLTMQRHKTRIFCEAEFIAYCNDMLNDNPVNDLEKNMIQTLGKYSTDPYAMIDYASIGDEDKFIFSKSNIEEVLESYLKSNVDYQRLRWFYRRISVIGTAGALDWTLQNIDELYPVINNIALYFVSVANTDMSDLDLHNIGKRLLDLLDNRIVKSNEFFQITILNLFSNTDKFNNISDLFRKYSNSSEYVKREIILSAFISKKSSLIKSIKSDYYSLGGWSKRAYIIASSLLTRDERKFFLQSAGIDREKCLSTKLIGKYVG